MVALAFAENSIQLVPDGTLILHVIVILVMVGVLNLTLFRPINRILEERDRQTRGRFGEAQQVLSRVDEAVSRYERGLRAARAEAYQLLERARADSLRERESKIVALKQEIGEWRLEQKSAIERQAEEARKVIAADSKKMAFDIGARILRRPIVDTGQMDLGA